MIEDFIYTNNRFHYSRSSPWKDGGHRSSRLWSYDANSRIKIRSHEAHLTDALHERSFVQYLSAWPGPILLVCVGVQEA